LGARASGFLATFGLAFPHEDGVVSDLHAASSALRRICCALLVGLARRGLLWLDKSRENPTWKTQIVAL